MTKFLSKEQVLTIHADLIERFGGSTGLRSDKLLESALSRMRSSFDGQDLYPGNFKKVAVLFESLIKNHPFVDGNKRVAFVCAVVFLEINGYATEFDQKESEKFVLEAASGKKTLRQIENFLRKSIK